MEKALLIGFFLILVPTSALFLSWQLALGVTVVEAIAAIGFFVWIISDINVS